MSIYPRSLRFALAAGGLAVLIVLSTNAARTSPTQLRVSETTTVQMPGIVKALGGLFGGAMKQATAPQTETRVLSVNRSREDLADGSTQIVQCDLQRTIYVKNDTKQYYVVPFDAMVKQMVAASKLVSKKMMTPSGSQVNGTGSMQVSLNETPDSQTKIIAGQTAHHVIQDVNIKFTGTGDCANFSTQMHNDLWYTSNPLRGYCPLVPKISRQQAAQVRQGMHTQCMQQMNVAARTQGHPADRYPLDETLTMSMNGMALGGTHTVVNTLQTEPYNPSLFDVPAGYTQVPLPTSPQ